MEAVDDLLDLVNSKFYHTRGRPALMASKRLAQTDTFNKVGLSKVSESPVSHENEYMPKMLGMTTDKNLSKTAEYSKGDNFDSENNKEYDACYKVEGDDSFEEDPYNRETAKKFYHARNQSTTSSKIENVSKARGFNIRKVNNKRPATQTGQTVLNLVPDMTPDMNTKQDYRPNLTENKLMNSKHVLFKTFNRYMTNPNSFHQKPNISDLVSLNANFVDSHMTIQLFRTGAMTAQKAILNT